MMIITPSGSIIDENILIELQEDGRIAYELDLSDYTSGIYTAVIQKGNSQSSEKFSVGLQLGSGPIQIQTTQTEYNQGQRILLLGSTNPNVLLSVMLVNPQGVEVKKLDVPSKNDGTFTVDSFKIPSNAMIGEWKIKANSGSNSDTAIVNVISSNDKTITITIDDGINIPGFGKNIKMGITTTQKTSVTIDVLDQNENIIGDSTSCTPTTDFKCEVLWTIPKDTIPGIYTVRVNDSIVIEQKTFEIK